MANEGDRRVPLTLIGGFLGSGKTTWLRHRLHHGEMAESLVVVNEAADVPVDDMLLFRSSEVRLLAGGCACCTGRERMVALLREFCNQRVDPDYAGRRFGHLVLETSGLADPGPIVDTIGTDPILQHHIVVREIVVAVDALHGLDYLKNEPLGRRQVGTADRLVITKADAAEEDRLRKLAATLARLNPSAGIEASAMGSPAPLPDFAGVPPEELPGNDGAPEEPVLSTVLKLEPGADWTAFATWLSALLHARGDDLVRVKGVMRTPAGRLLLQSVRRVVQSPEILPDTVTQGKDENSIVFIGKGFRPRELVNSLHYFTGIHAQDESSERAAEK